MNYLSTNYDEFINLKLNETTATGTKIKPSPIDYAKVKCQKEKMNALNRQLFAEKDPKEKVRLQREIKICELKILVLTTK